MTATEHLTRACRELKVAFSGHEDPASGKIQLFLFRQGQLFSMGEGDTVDEALVDALVDAGVVT